MASPTRPRKIAASAPKMSSSSGKLSLSVFYFLHFGYNFSAKSETFNSRYSAWSSNKSIGLSCAVLDFG